jgi:steroid 5-alpha reductase family enzyme
VQSGEYVIGRRLAGVSRPVALVLVALVYVVAAVAGILVAWASGRHPITAAFYGDVVATLVVFALSMAVGNSSLYDPYWSVAPPVIAAGWLVVAPAGTPGRQSLVLLLITVWAIRLTANWAVGWHGLSHEDWRYVQLRGETRGRLPWWLLSLTGIQLMPTFMVFAGMLSVWPALVGNRALNVIDALALIVTGGAIVVEALADVQLRRFTGDPANRGRVAEVGLWRWSRHPNYLGEITFWWGLWLFGVAAAPDWWWTAVGPIAMVALFVFVSVPLMEQRSLQRRPDYAEYAQRVPALLPRPAPRR